LRGRSSGEWARTKLSFLDEYIPPALAVTHRFPRRWFLDLFAGPGRNVDRRRGLGEFDGSPLRALELHGTDRAQTAFSDAVFINKVEEDHLALTERVDRMVAAGRSRIRRDRIILLNEDTNQALPSVMSRIGVRDYVVAFADITGPGHWPFTSVQQLKYHHKSVDFYALFPLEMALVRKLSFSEAMMERYAYDLTAFFGTEEWREIWERRRTSADTARLKLELTELYERQLKTLWSYAFMQEKIGITAKQRLYGMFFATDNPIASKLAKWQRSKDQGDLFG
jgi:three-Cys-motif partner protein